MATDYKYKFYQLRLPMPSYLELPDFLKDAIATEDVRLTADGEDMYVRTPTNEVHVEPTDYVLKSSIGSFYVVSALLFEDLAGVRDDGVLHASPRPESEPAPTPAAAIPTPLGAPPYSSAVLAKSARARAEQATWESTPPSSPSPEATLNARIEGDVDK